MGKKKFINKKKSATFQLFARDSSDPNYDDGLAGDRVFVRVDNNPYSFEGFVDEGTEDVSVADGDDHIAATDDPDSIFANAPGDNDGDDEEFVIPKHQFRTPVTGATPLPDQIRREILELGLPDDGYNYLRHLREIKNTGGGSAYYHNSKAKLDEVPLDVKAFDASRVRIFRVDDDSNENSIYNVASKTIGVKIQKVVDPEVVALLDDSDFSRFGSDVEDLEEDFIVQANLPEEGEDVIVDKKLNSFGKSQVIKMVDNISDNYAPQEHEVDFAAKDGLKDHQLETADDFLDEKPRVRRLLDEQFDLLALQEYGSNTDIDDDDSIAEESEFLVGKLSHALKDHLMDDLKVDDKYIVPADILHRDGGLHNGEILDSAADVIRRCVEYAEKYDNENQDNEEVVLQESSDESEVWDCETIVSTYSNLDNHPGKIRAPENARRKKLTETVFGVSSASAKVISLRGKQKLPIEFLPQSRKAVPEKVKGVTSSKIEQKRGLESKEEKKERKAAVKEERREARRTKKEIKGLYRCEGQRAQKVAAISGPQSIHLM